MTAKQIHFIRHAQSEHNARAAIAPDEDIVRHDPALRDARLTPLGQDQAKALSAEISGLRDIELVVVSPLTRTIQTTIAAFADHTAPRHIEPLHREKQESRKAIVISVANHMNWNRNLPVLGLITLMTPGGLMVHWTAHHTPAKHWKRLNSASPVSLTGCRHARSIASPLSAMAHSCAT